jgi:CheY-like chemotaxis protein
VTVPPDAAVSVPPLAPIRALRTDVMLERARAWFERLVLFEWALAILVVLAASRGSLEGPGGARLLATVVVGSTLVAVPYAMARSARARRFTCHAMAVSLASFPVLLHEVSDGDVPVVRHLLLVLFLASLAVDASIVLTVAGTAGALDLAYRLFIPGGHLLDVQAMVWLGVAAFTLALGVSRVRRTLDAIVAERAHLERERARVDATSAQACEVQLRARLREAERLQRDTEIAERTQVLASLTHELRTPLNAIVGYLELLDRSSLTLPQRGHVEGARSTCSRSSRTCSTWRRSRAAPSSSSVHRSTSAAACAMPRGWSKARCERGRSRSRSTWPRISPSPSSATPSACGRSSSTCSATPSSSRARRSRYGPAGWERPTRSWSRSVTTVPASLRTAWLASSSRIGRPIAPSLVGTEETTVEVPPLSVLFADDNASNRLVGGQLLKLLGHQVELASDGEDAMARALVTAHDLLILDVEMPKLDGTEVARRLRTAGLTVPILGFTGHTSAQQRAACLRAGMDGVVAKPADLPRLSRAIAEVISPAHARPDNGRAIAKSLAANVGVPTPPVGLSRPAVVEALAGRTRSPRSWRTRSPSSPTSPWVARLMRGDLVAASEPGAGSTFTFVAPLRRAEAADLAAARPVARASASSSRGA